MHGVGNTGVTDQGWQPESDRVLAHDHAKVDAGQNPQAPIAQKLCDRGVRDFLAVVLGQLFADERLFFIGQPGSLLDAILKVSKHHQADNDSWNGFKDEHPLPASPTLEAGKLRHDPA